MDIQTKDGITLRGIPDGTPDETIKARIAQIRAEGAPREPVSAPPAPADTPAAAPAKPNFLDMPERNLSPRERVALAAMQNKPWGSGLPSVAYDAGGKVTDLATGAGASPEVAAGAGYVANVVTQAIPSLMTGKLVQEKAAPLMQEGARALMQSAVKPTLEAHRSGDAAKAIDTLLKEGFNPTKGGVLAMEKRIAELSAEISDSIKNSTAVVNKNDVAARLGDALERFRKQVNPQADLATIEEAWSKFLSHPDLVGKINFPVQLAQAMKTGTYRAIGDKPYGELSGASIEAQKHLARGLKEEISAAVPGVAARNEIEGALINAKNIAERRVMMSGNNNPMSLAWLASNPKAALGFIADKSDLLKALFARAMNSGAERIPQAVGSGAGATLMAQTGQAPALTPQQQAIARAIAERQQGGN